MMDKSVKPRATVDKGGNKRKPRAEKQPRVDKSKTSKSENLEKVKILAAPNLGLNTCNNNCQRWKKNQGQDYRQGKGKRENPGLAEKTRVGVPQS